MVQFVTRVISWLQIPFNWFYDIISYYPALVLFILGSITLSFLYFIIKFFAKRA